MISNPLYTEKKGHVANACVHCRMKKHGCEDLRPCGRCKFENVVCLPSVRIDRRTTSLNTQAIIKKVQKLHNDVVLCTNHTIDRIEDGWTVERLHRLTVADREGLNKHIKKLEEEIVLILTQWKRQQVQVDAKAHETAASRNDPVTHPTSFFAPRGYEIIVHTGVKLENDYNSRANNAQAYYPSMGFSPSPTTTFSQQSHAPNSKDETPFANASSTSLEVSALEYGQFSVGSLYEGNSLSVIARSGPDNANAHDPLSYMRSFGYHNAKASHGLVQAYDSSSAMYHHVQANLSASGNAYQSSLLQDADIWWGCSGHSGTDHQTPASTTERFSSADPSRSPAVINLNQTPYNWLLNGHRGGCNTTTNSPNNFPMPPENVTNESGNTSSEPDPFTPLYQYHTQARPT